MYIYEEYAKRKNINIDFLARYHQKSCVFLNKNYKIIDISKVYNNNVHPSFFRIIESEPDRNSRGLKSNYFVDLNFEEYQDYIDKNLKSKNNCLEDPKKIFNFGWNVFLISNEIELEKKISPNLIYSAFDDLENRKKLLEILKNEFYHIYFSWLDIEERIKNYSYWLSKIINS